jgi:primosomal protein N' (replication factor Y)
LTYSSTKELAKGTIILVPFRNKIVLGLVKTKTDKPKFKVKPVDKLIHSKSLPETSIKLLEWLMLYYPSSSSTHLQLFLPSSINKIEDLSTTKAESSAKTLGINPPDLTIEQKSSIKAIQNNNSRTFLLHGDTGSGKTRVYIELIKENLAKSKSVLVLVPEIGLSPQITKSLKDYFPNDIVVMNSSLTPKNKRDNWEKILVSKTPIIVIGPRSALFSPINNLGLIIMDEAHDSSYKQESAPFYQTSRVAAKLAGITNSKLVMGTATPLIADYYLFSQMKLPIIRMKKSAITANPKAKINIQIVNLTDRSLFSKSTWISDSLLGLIKDSLGANEQSLIFLNRRGTAAVIACQNCGWKALCPNCNISLTYHGDSHTILCHSCGFKDMSPSICPICKSHDISFRGIGTKAVEVELNKLFPNANIKRFDRDNSKSESLAMGYSDIKKGKIDIIIGTQIITKGLDLPNLTTVGIVMADQSLSFPDFSSEEKSYQTLLQVIGRVGRGHQVKSNIIIQSFNPESKPLKAAIKKDYTNFYNDQINSRKKYLFPPFVFLLKVYCKKHSLGKAIKDSSVIIKKIKGLNLPIKISDPAPAFHERINGKYIWQFVVKSKNRQSLLDIISIIPNDWFYDIDPNSLL